MSLYDTDFAQWAQTQAALLKAGAFDALDLPNLIEEVDDLSRRERRALESRLLQLVVHLLKWRYQPSGRQTGHSWESSIREQRLRLARRLRESPSLRPTLPALLADIYPEAVLRASRQTHVPEAALPSACLWSVEQILADDFWPEEVRYV
jgi:Domain of unknown function DUF29